jgi:hypothetical protein
VLDASFTIIPVVVAVCPVAYTIIDLCPASYINTAPCTSYTHSRLSLKNWKMFPSMDWCHMKNQFVKNTQGAGAGVAASSSHG